MTAIRNIENYLRRPHHVGEVELWCTVIARAVVDAARRQDNWVGIDALTYINSRGMDLLCNMLGYPHLTGDSIRRGTRRCMQEVWVEEWVEVYG